MAASWSHHREMKTRLTSLPSLRSIVHSSSTIATHTVHHPHRIHPVTSPPLSNITNTLFITWSSIWRRSPTPLSVCTPSPSISIIMDNADAHTMPCSPFHCQQHAQRIYAHHHPSSALYHPGHSHTPTNQGPHGWMIFAAQMYTVLCPSLVSSLSLLINCPQHCSLLSQRPSSSHLRLARPVLFWSAPVSDLVLALVRLSFRHSLSFLARLCH